MVFGLREVRRGVRAQQVKCLIVAPNVSDGEELQRQITEILDGAAAAKIPVAFALGKRRLGKALRKQSCSVLAIYSDDGAVDGDSAAVSGSAIGGGGMTSCGPRIRTLETPLGSARGVEEEWADADELCDYVRAWRGHITEKEFRAAAAEHAREKAPAGVRPRR